MIKKKMAACVGALLWLPLMPASGESINFGTDTGTHSQSTVKFWNAPGNGSDYLIVLPHTGSGLPIPITEFDLTTYITTQNTRVYCKNGGHVGNLHLVNSDPGLKSKSPHTGMNGEPLLNTSVPGLYFSLEISEPSVTEHQNLFLSPEKTYSFPINDGTALWNLDDSGNTGGCANNLPRTTPAEIGTFNLKSRLRFYIDANYNPQAGQQLSGSYNFYLAMTNSNIKTEIRESFVGFTVAPPTCLTSAVTSTEAGALSGDGSGMRYTVNLGSYYPSDVREGKTKKIPFTVNLGRCVAVDVLKITVTGKPSAHNAELFANANGSAKNTAVKLNSVNGGTEKPFYPGVELRANGQRNALGPALINRFTGDVPIGEGTPGEFSLDFNAQLVPEDPNKPVAPGSVSALSTLLFDYP